MTNEEFQAIKRIMKAFNALSDPGQKRRVLRYVADLLGVTAASGPPGESGMIAENAFDLPVHLRMLFAENQIETIADKILITLFQVQELKGGRGQMVSAREIRAPLEAAGVVIPNLSAHLSAIADRQRRPSITWRKPEGRQKLYSVTKSGQLEVRRLLLGKE